MKHSLTRTFAIAIMLFSTLALTQSPAQASTESKYPCPQWHDELRAHGLPVKIFAPIMWRESKCKAKAVGWNYHKGMSHKDCKLAPAAQYRKCKAVKSYDIGLLQINSSWKTLTSQVCKVKLGRIFVLQKPECNLAVAKVLYNNGKGLANWRGTSGSK